MELIIYKDEHAKFGEICIGYFTRNHYKDLITTWLTKRIGEISLPCKKDSVSIYPVFIQRDEAEKKGWSFGRGYKRFIPR
jgi:hypothetical protein